MKCHIYGLNEPSGHLVVYEVQVVFFYDMKILVFSRGIPFRNISDNVHSFLKQNPDGFRSL